MLLLVASDQVDSQKLEMQNLIILHCSPLQCNIKRATCIKGLLWPPLEPKTESCFHQFLLFGLLEELPKCKILAFI